jgi:hypothetical protein
MCLGVPEHLADGLVDCGELGLRPPRALSSEVVDRQLGGLPRKHVPELELSLATPPPVFLEHLGPSSLELDRYPGSHRPGTVAAVRQGLDVRQVEEVSVTMLDAHARRSASCQARSNSSAVISCSSRMSSTSSG